MYDYIVVGAGSAGCLVANRLSEHHRVLLIEAGGTDDTLWTKVPMGIQRLLGDPEKMWLDRTAPGAGIGGRSIVLAQGKILGGSSSVNGMMYVRGQREDYDGWAADGCPGWSWDELMPLFRRHTRMEGGDAAAVYGEGELNLCFMPDPHPTTLAFVEAAQSAGLPFNETMNDGDQIGVGRVLGNIRDGVRQSSSVAFLDPIRERDSLEVLADTQVRRVVFNGKHAIGVEIIAEDGTVQVIDCRREVVLSAGALNSPAILQRSGVGDDSQLASLGIPVVTNLPGVGANLQDHLFGHLKFKLREDTDSNNRVFSDPAALAASLEQWQADGSGPLNSTSSQALAFFSTDPSNPSPDVQLAMRPLSLSIDSGGSPQIDTFSGMMVSAIAARPWSRGSVRIASPDPDLRPVVDPGYLSDPRDLDTLVAGIRKCRDIAAQKPLAGLAEAELEPGPAATTDDQLKDYLRAAVQTVYHPVGTCRMGTGLTSVVDPSLRVHGVSGLRVVDASVMPQITSGNTNAPTYVIAEKGAALILDDTEAPPRPRQP